uniref:DUF4209 domain-containing protein n=1 Tax=Globisporangium ultimum (strain ATCC 200006 / CBS 805.95 / DAOM BR144) TaxID=431595 RepID=K3W697_GLOUD
MRRELGARVTIAQRALLSRGVLTYVPSLSVGVYDVLFSYWRLPLSVRHAVAQELPVVHVSSSSIGAIDWDRFLRSMERNHLQGIANPMETTWALALHAETVVTRHAALWRHDERVVTHGEHLEALAAVLQDARGEFYMAFVVLITVLERALYDVYHVHHDLKTEKKKKNMILRDLLASTTLARVLPSGFLRLLQTLFLPSGLNLRNLVWHGFMVPAEFPKCFSSLTLVLIMALAPYLKAPSDDGAEAMNEEDKALFTIESFNNRFVFQNGGVLRDHVVGASEWIEKLLQGDSDLTSPFIPRGRERLVRKALTALIHDGDELWFLFALLPVLEHAVRIQFLASNQVKWGISSEYGTAQLDAYYSTLDGFGQRDKHQVLLHPQVMLADMPMAEGGEAPPALNQLYTTFPPAALAVCLDLFMMSTGPNLRAKLCHGEADLAGLLLQSNPKKPISVAGQLVLLAWHSLCAAREGRSESRLPTALPRDILVSAFHHEYTSSFHPFHQLRRALASTYARSKGFAALRAHWTTFRVEKKNGVEDMTWIEFPNERVVDVADDGGVRSVFGLFEKASRIHEFQGYLELANGAFSWNSMASSSLSHNSAGAQVLGDLRTSTTTEDTNLLALSDDDGLSVAACMLEIINSARRSLESFETRFRQLQLMIAAGAARTNHRRSFVTSVFFLPVFERVQLLALTLVEHQLVHLVARAKSFSHEPSSQSSYCPQSRAFEALQRKLLQFITAFEGCTGASEAASQKSGEKTLQLALQFLDSKAMESLR